MAPSPEITFQHRFDATIWNIVPFLDRDRIVMEIRDATLHRVEFVLMDLVSKTLRPCLKGQKLTWWTSIIEAQGDVMVIQQFHDTENVDDKSILGMDMERDKLLWKYDKCDFVRIHEGKMICAYRTEEDTVYSTVDLVTGERKRIDKELTMSSGQQNTAPSKNNTIGYPLQYMEGHAYFDTVGTFLKDKVGQPAQGAIEYAEVAHLEVLDEGMIISYYVGEAHNLANFLIVLDSNGNIVLKELLDEKLKGIGLGTFFIMSGHLVYVRNKRELVIY